MLMMIKIIIMITRYLSNVLSNILKLSWIFLSAMWSEATMTASSVSGFSA